MTAYDELDLYILVNDGEGDFHHRIDAGPGTWNLCIMDALLQSLLAHLSLERLEENLFRGTSKDLGWGTVFGGQVLGQALSAAAQTVGNDLSAHSLHGYFLRPGDVSRSIVFEVDRIRDGKSFTTRRVVAIQNGRAIFNMSASFQKLEDGFEHQADMPATPAPDGLATERELVERIIDKIPPAKRKWLLQDSPIEVRRTAPINFVEPEVRPPHRSIWYRIKGELPDDPLLHRALLAYISDFNLIGTAMQAHGVSWMMPGMQVASLDHAMWFHRPFSLNDWILHVMESPSASAARALVQGRFYTPDGTLVASTAQEGLMRQWR